jgi:hypothetical protein
MNPIPFLNEELTTHAVEDVGHVTHAAAWTLTSLSSRQANRFSALPSGLSLKVKSRRVNADDCNAARFCGSVTSFSIVLASIRQAT